MGSLALTGPRATEQKENMLRNLRNILSKSLEISVGYSEKVGYYRKLYWTINF